jgi:hypothetical protein
MPESTRCSWPLHQVPTSPNCAPYFLKTESSPTQSHSLGTRCTPSCRVGLWWWPSVHVHVPPRVGENGVTLRHVLPGLPAFFS